MSADPLTAAELRARYGIWPQWLTAQRKAGRLAPVAGKAHNRYNPLRYRLEDVQSLRNGHDTAKKDAVIWHLVKADDGPHLTHREAADETMCSESGIRWSLMREALRRAQSSS